MNRAGENFSLRFFGNDQVEISRDTSLPFYNMGSAKRTGVSNPLRSTNASVLTAGPLSIVGAD